MTKTNNKATLKQVGSLHEYTSPEKINMTKPTTTPRSSKHDYSMNTSPDLPNTLYAAAEAAALTSKSTSGDGAEK